MPEFSLALVTGASSGIGQQLCRLFAQKGIDLIITARNKSALAALAEELGDKVKVVVCSADLADRRERQAVVATLRENSPDLVVNNAGWGYYGEALSQETATSMEMLEVDAAAVLELSLEAARAMMAEKKPGVIMNISSSAAFQIFPLFAVYAASKAFVNRFSESFDVEMRPHGIRVLAACPGMVETNFGPLAGAEGASHSDALSKMDVAFAAEQIWRQIVQRQPLRAFDWKYRLGIFLSQYLLPKRLVAWVLKRTIEAKQRTQRK